MVPLPHLMIWKYNIVKQKMQQETICMNQLREKNWLSEP